MKIRVLALLGLLLLATSCRPHSSIVVGSKNFTEQAILGEILAQHLEQRTGLPVERRFYLAGSYICHQALLAGRIDMYVEYTGTALTAILKEKPTGDRTAVYDLVKQQYDRRFGLRVQPSLGFNNSFAMVIRGEDARRLHLRTLSQAEQYSGAWRLGVGYEFMERPDGYAGLAKTYNLHFAAAPRIMDLGLLYRALEAKEVDIIAASATDGLISALDLVVLEDDRHYFPPYEAVPIVRPETLAKFPAVRAALSDLAGRISERDMRELNYRVDGKHEDIKAVVAEFLRRKSI